MEFKSPVAVSKCGSYESKEVNTALKNIIDSIGGLDFVRAGMRIAIKTNLVSAASPDRAVTVHPSVLVELTKILRGMGAEVIIGDSPGGPFNGVTLPHFYRVCGLEECVKYGAKLNDNFDGTYTFFENGTTMKRASITSWLTEADAIIGVCKLKTHGMMRMSANVKNFFGAIPGATKLEYHYRFPNHKDFANMLVDINELLKPRLYITDAVVGMEGNGPTAGTPREIGCVLASKNPYSLDMICADIIGLKSTDVPTIAASQKRGLCPENLSDVPVIGEYWEHKIADYKNIALTGDIGFGGWFLPKNLVPVINKMAQPKPNVKEKECIACGKCGKICPAKAITMDKTPKIDREKCIRCFCCQEFCPTGAMKVKKPFLAKIFEKL